ncbi:hypothetical protein TRFO_16345 [Tritrichomonas foetus]|uniref:Uncharacterized protein n=1 Tax=Tritrichomonas foetus TaxID=1144522 RepID=A0A1J4KUW9_9EUKA|nr:hypothetical protein TRFO_16345 [Tritrichomonas foetus]|eukprot:OHT13478.1 hypothetical protein TRFO_16345 [Tritrichomonas foetus]
MDFHCNTLDTIHCTCQHLHASGKNVAIDHHLGISKSLLQKMLENSKSPANSQTKTYNKVIQIRNGSIGITDVKNIICQKVKSNLYYVSCRQCNSILVIYLGRGSVYAQFSTDVIKDRLRLSEAMLNHSLISQNQQIPPIILQMIRFDEVSKESFVSYDNGMSSGSEFLSPMNENEEENSINDNFDEAERNCVDQCIANDENDVDYDLMFSGNNMIVVGSVSHSTTFGLYV